MYETANSANRSTTSNGFMSDSSADILSVGREILAQVAGSVTVSVLRTFFVADIIIWNSATNHPASRDFRR